MIIYARSPYFVEINEAGQVGSKVELLIYNAPNSVPTTPTYTIAKSAASATQRAGVYNISPFIREYIDNIVSSDSTNNRWCNVRVNKYKETSAGVYSLIRYDDFACVDGYTNYMGGYNQDEVFGRCAILADDTKEIQYLYGNTHFIDVVSDISLGDRLDVEYRDLSGNNATTVNVLPSTTPSKKYMNKVNVTTTSPNYANGNTITFKYYVGATLSYSSTFRVIPICEPKYTPVVCSFINRFGGWQFLTFFKAQTNAINVTSTNYSLLPSSVNYNVYKGQNKSFNINGNQSVILNTGFVPENYSDLIQDLLLSETVLLDNKPANVKTQATDLKSSLKDNNINYTIEFEYAYNLINNVI